MREVKNTKVTIHVGTDKYSGTMVGLSDSGKTFEFVFDNRPDERLIARYTVRKGKGAWRSKGYILTVGEGINYYDPHF